MSKKTKKTKGKTLNLTEFLGGGPAAPQDDGFAAVTAPKSSWADEMDDYDDSPRFSSGRSETIVLPTAPRAARGLDIDESRIPNAPPYTAYVANLSYDVDVEEIMEFFGKLKITGVRLPRDGDPETGRLKGFGYADFADRDSLVEALKMNEHSLSGRKVRIDLSTHAGKDGDRGGFGGRRGRYDDDDGEDRTTGDWRSGPREVPQGRSPPRGDRDRGYGDRDRGDRDGGRRGFDRYEAPRDRGGYDRGGDRDRDRDGRGGGGGFDDFDRSQMRSSNDRDRDRDQDRGGFDRRDDRGGYGRDRRDGGDRYGDRGGDRGFDRRDDRYDRRDGYDRRDDRYDRDRRDRPRSPDGPPRERQRLQLAKRTVPAEQSASGGASSSSIFGSAKPVDTARKEKEIEDKMDKGGKKEYPPTKDGERRRDSAERGGRSPTPEDDRPKKTGGAGSSIFGGAKPVDTAKKEKEIEEKLDKGGKREYPPTKDGERRRDSRERGERSPSPDDDRPKKTGGAGSSIFGSAKPVDTARKEKEIEEKLDKGRERDDEPRKEEDRRRKSSEREERSPSPAADDRPKRTGGAGASIFGAAKPVDTMAKEKEIEERLMKKRKEEEEARAKEQDRDGDRRDGDRRGGPRRIELNRDRRDGDRDRRDGDRDDRDGGHDRRDNRDDRRGDRPRDGETSSRRDSDKRDDRKERPAQPKKIEEQKPPNFVGANKFAFLEGEDGDSAPDSDE